MSRKASLAGGLVAAFLAATLVPLTRLHAGVLLAALAGLTAPVRAGASDHTLDFYWIDSEGGGSTLIVTPTGESVLIDTGNPGGRDSQRILAAVKAAGLTKIDHMMLTHFHIDHFGGAAEVTQERHIRHGDFDRRRQPCRCD